MPVFHKTSLTWKNIIIVAARIVQEGRKSSFCMVVVLIQRQLKKFAVVIPMDHDPETINRIYFRLRGSEVLTLKNFNW
jgi:hypothetical protein